MFEWLQNYEPLFWWLFTFSILSFIGTLIAVPMLLVRIPYDYFAYEKRRALSEDKRHFLITAALVVLKNAIGAVLLLMGILMLVTPGQGILTILIGLMLLNYPGKYQLERWIVSRRAVYRSINWFRARAGRRRLQLK